MNFKQKHKDALLEEAIIDSGTTFVLNSSPGPKYWMKQHVCSPPYSRPFVGISPTFRPLSSFGKLGTPTSSALSTSLRGMLYAGCACSLHWRNYLPHYLTWLMKEVACGYLPKTQNFLRKAKFQLTATYSFSSLSPRTFHQRLIYHLVFPTDRAKTRQYLHPSVLPNK